MKAKNKLSETRLAAAVKAYSRTAADAMPDERTLSEQYDPPVKAAALFASSGAALPVRRENRVARFAAIAASVVMIFGVLGVGAWFIRTQPGVLDPTDAPTELPSVTSAPSVAPTIAPVSPSPSPSPEPQQLEIGPFIELDWPEHPAVYQPEVKVFPMTNTRSVYKTVVSGTETFVDADLNPVELPAGTKSHANIYSNWSNRSNWNSSPKAYALQVIPPDDNAPDYSIWCLMLADGTIPLDADGHHILLPNYGEDGPFFYNLGTTVVTHSFSGDKRRHGLYDLEERRELVTAEYDWIEPLDEVFYFAVRDDMSYLLDSKGKLLFSIPGSHDIAIMETPHRQSVEAQYVLYSQRRVFYKISDHYGAKYDLLEKWHDLYFCISYSRMAGSPNFAYITDLDGRELRQIAFLSRYVQDDVAIFATVSKFVVVDASGHTREFPAPLLGAYVGNVELVGHEIHYTDYNNHHDYWVDEAGNIREDEFMQEDDRVFFRYYTDTAPQLYQLRDEQNNVLLEAPDPLDDRGDFVLAFSSEGYEERVAPVLRAVHATDGTLLLGDVYGAVYEATGPDGGMLVYLDAQTCVLLYPDGRTVPVPNAPAVVSEYLGG